MTQNKRRNGSEETKEWLCRNDGNRQKGKKEKEIIRMEEIKA